MKYPAMIAFVAIVMVLVLPSSAVRPPIIGQSPVVKAQLGMTPREMLHQKWEETNGVQADGQPREHRRDQHVERPRGIVLWALGRSGTSAFWDSMDKWTRQIDVKLHLLCGKKEGFLAEKASRLRLHKCFKEIPATEPFFTHLKPGHIDPTSDVPTTYEFLRLARNQGAKVLVIVRRENWLARAVSSAELYMDKTPETRVLGSQARIDAMYEYFRHFSTDEVSPKWAERLARKAGQEIDDGERDAAELGYRIISFYYDKNEWPCDEVEQTLQAAVEEGILSHMPSEDCEESHKMADISHRNITLEERVGHRAARLITENMRLSTHEWMLDLSAENKPAESTKRSKDDLVLSLAQGNTV